MFEPALFTTGRSGSGLTFWLGADRQRKAVLCGARLNVQRYPVYKATPNPLIGPDAFNWAGGGDALAVFER
jgi:hypothetical protein